MQQSKAIRHFFLLFLLLIAVNSRGLGAQSGTSSAISGTVIDASGAVVANASVTATEVDTKATRAGQTDAGGHYLFSQVNPGTYRIVVRLAGFADAESAADAGGRGTQRGAEFHAAGEFHIANRGGDRAAGPADSR